MIRNEENIYELERSVQMNKHVHISELGLKPIKKRELHKKLEQILSEYNYSGYISIEMGKVEELSVIEENYSM